MSDWYMAPDSGCPECDHGPRWHDDPSGCMRMNGGWCQCPYQYAPTATGPDDRTADPDELAHYLAWVAVDIPAVSRKADQ